MGKGVLTILTLGIVGGIAFSALTHPQGLKAVADGLDSLYRTAGGLTLGQVA